jgi:hypothetical protein
LNNFKFEKWSVFINQRVIGVTMAVVFAVPNPQAHDLLIANVMNVNLKTALEKTEHFSNLKLFN